MTPPPLQDKVPLFHDFFTARLRGLEELKIMSAVAEDFTDKEIFVWSNLCLSVSADIFYLDNMKVNISFYIKCGQILQ